MFTSALVAERVQRILQKVLTRLGCLEYRARVLIARTYGALHARAGFSTPYSIALHLAVAMELSSNFPVGHLSDSPQGRAVLSNSTEAFGRKPGGATHEDD